MSRTAFLRLEWLLSIGLTLLSILWAALRDLPLAAALRPSLAGVATGLAAGAALWATIPILLRSPSMRRVWTEVLLPFSRSLDTRDVVVIALLSGLTEELFFRGILLPELGLVASSLCFGALHALCGAYFVWATLVGAAFSALALTAGSLIPAIVAHATYNFGALLILRRASIDAPAAVDTAIASPHGIG